MWERISLFLARVSVAELRREDGQTTVEYTLMVLVAVLMAAGLALWLSPTLLDSVKTAITTAIGTIK